MKTIIQFVIKNSKIIIPIAMELGQMIYSNRKKIYDKVRGWFVKEKAQDDPAPDK